MISRPRSIVVLVPAFLVALAAGACQPLETQGFRAGAVEAQAAEARARVPMPPGATFRPLVLEKDGVYEAGEGRSLIEFQSMCAWYGYWLEALKQADGERIEEARATVTTFATWETYRSMDQSGRDFLTSIAQRAELGDPSGLTEMIQNNCR